MVECLVRRPLQRLLHEDGCLPVLLLLVVDHRERHERLFALLGLLGLLHRLQRVIVAAKLEVDEAEVEIRRRR